MKIANGHLKVKSRRSVVSWAWRVHRKVAACVPCSTSISSDSTIKVCRATHVAACHGSVFTRAGAAALQRCSVCEACSSRTHQESVVVPRSLCGWPSVPRPHSRSSEVD